MIKVGIPRGLMYYDYYPLWKEFFEELGAKVIVSSNTNKEILNKGVSSSVDEACLPVKVFHGHVEDLKNRVDYIFIPKIISVYKREYTCPKILGLPDMIKNSIEGLPEIIDVKIDLLKSKNNILISVLETGKYFTRNPLKIIRAYNNALKRYNNYKGLLQSGYTPIEAFNLYKNSYNEEKINDENNLNIMVLGHPYNIYDNYINMDTINKLRDENINVLTPEMIEVEKSNHYCKMLPKRMFWTFGRRIVGSSFSVMYEKKVDGIVYISAFGCGLDSILEDMVRRKANELNVPFTLLTIDEHSGQAGVNTRIEAFTDMIGWRVKNENNISTHG
ncbi:acyl-CoA dehydratase activase-related protein [Gottschalkia acidurici]|uniref:acyl-CoA dehydratase activase-related protein n=1 Tax=Clostridium acidurici TaxID=1556 RepID=UPI000306F6CE|nr:acyl-CoA dehydratase activase-related protein [Gottschalkia acidurici]